MGCLDFYCQNFVFIAFLPSVGSGPLQPISKSYNYIFKRNCWLTWIWKLSSVFNFLWNESKITLKVEEHLCKHEGRPVVLRPVVSHTFSKRQLRKIRSMPGCLSRGSSIKLLVVINRLFLPQHCDVSWMTVYSRCTVYFLLKH